MTTTDPLAELRRSETILEALWASLCHAVRWPGRVRRVRRLLGQLGQMEDYELRDIGLMRQDLRDASALGLDTDPSFMLRHRARRHHRQRCRN